MLTIIVAALIGTAVMAAFFGLYSDTVNIYDQEPFDDDVSVFTDTGTYEETARDIRVSVEGETDVTTEQSEVNFINAGFTSILKAGTAVTALISIIYNAAELGGIPAYVTVSLVGVLIAVFAFAVIKILTGRD